MWRRLYLGLVAVRLYFAVRASYIHPDEHFQGPEIIAGEVFGWPTYKTWEFTSSEPIRSVFPLWLAYGFPLTLLKWIWEGLGYGGVPPMVAFYTLRTLMFVLGFVLEDWALHELLPATRERTRAIALVASSYVTWTFQTHTFSNSLETLLVLWSIVLMRRIRDHEASTMPKACASLAFLGVLGIFNRITFPAFLVIPAIQVVPHLFKRTLRIPIILISAFITIAVGITMDTEYYGGTRPRIRHMAVDAVFTPLNNLIYNFDTTNLAEHGLHPFWQHFVANLPQLIGPAFPLLLFSARKDSVFWSALIGIAILSCFRHQEPRFLLPAVPLLLASIQIPSRMSRVWIVAWTIFNLSAGVIFGVYHQAGVVPAQAWLSSFSEQHPQDVSQVLWWKTYSPPRWLLDGENIHITTTDLMGLPGQQMIERLASASTCSRRGANTNKTLLIAPSSATFLDPYVAEEGEASPTTPITLHELWRYRQHIGLDDLDFGEDGVWPTLRRVIGRRGLVVWGVEKKC